MDIILAVLLHYTFSCLFWKIYWKKLTSHVRKETKTKLTKSNYIVTEAELEILKWGALCVGHHGWPTKKMLGLRWSKKAKITLETISFWENVSISIFKFSPFLYIMKACQRNLILVMNITQTNFLCRQNAHISCLIKVNYKRSL